MNRLEFSEGGQPVYLDDLRLLQENMVKLILSLYPLTNGAADETSDENGIRDVRKCTVWATPRHMNGSGDRNYNILQAHKLLTTDGKVYDVAETTFGDDDGHPMTGYYVLQETTQESRTFEDGSEKAVVKSYTATIVPKAQKPESGTVIAVADVPSLDQLQALLPCPESCKKYLTTDQQ